MLTVTGSCDLTDLEAELHELRESLLTAEIARADEIAAAHPRHRRSVVSQGIASMSASTYPSEVV